MFLLHKRIIHQKDMLGFLWRILIVLGQGGQLDAGAFHFPEKFRIRQVGFQFQEKMQAGIFFGDFGVGSQRASVYCSKLETVQE